MPTVERKVRSDTPTKRFIKDFLEKKIPGAEIYDNAPTTGSIRKALNELRDEDDRFPVKLIERTFNNVQRRFLINIDEVPIPTAQPPKEDYDISLVDALDQIDELERQHPGIVYMAYSGDGDPRK